MRNIFENYWFDVVKTKINNLKALLGNAEDNGEKGKSDIYNIRRKKCNFQRIVENQT